MIGSSQRRSVNVNGLSSSRHYDNSTSILAGTTRTKLRGEDDDFDEEDEPEAEIRRGNTDNLFNIPDELEILRVKQEELEELEDEVDDPDYAEQQALFQQSYARMQVEQPQSAAPLPLIDVATLYPSFAPGKILNFTELFTPRPRKRLRIDPNAELCRYRSFCAAYHR